MSAFGNCIRRHPPIKEKVARRHYVMRSARLQITRHSMSVSFARLITCCLLEGQSTKITTTISLITDHSSFIKSCHDRIITIASSFKDPRDTTSIAESPSHNLSELLTQIDPPIQSILDAVARHADPSQGPVETGHTSSQGRCVREQILDSIGFELSDQIGFEP